MKINITSNGYFRVLKPDGSLLSQHSQIKEAYENAIEDASGNVDAEGDSGIYTITSPIQTVQISEMIVAAPPVEEPPVEEPPVEEPPVEEPPVEEPPVEEPPVVTPPNGSLRLNLDYVDKTSAEYNALISLVDTQLAGTNNYGFEAKDAVWAYRLTGRESYRALAVQLVDAQVTAAEARIAAGQAPAVAGDSYLETGPMITDLAHTYQFCSPTDAQKARWKVYADQTIYNVWHQGSDTWGGRSFPDTGWGMNDPGNNYFYSFCHATVTWALASNNTALIDFLRNDRFPMLNSYFGQLVGGGSREGTGYGLSAKGVFEFMQVWKDSGYEVPVNVMNHARDSVKFWTHALLPIRNVYQPIGDLARESYPNLMEYHLELVLRAGHLVGGETKAIAGAFARKAIRNPNYNRTWARRNALFAPSTDTAPVQPLNYYGVGTGNVFGRTGWDDGARYAHFIAGPYDQSHAHQEQGGFTYGAGGFLSVTNNIFTNSGIEQGVDYHNVLKFSRGTTIIRQRETTVTSSVTLGVDGSFNASANLKPVYTDSGVQSYSRSVNFSNGQLMVSDTFAKSADVTAIFQLHTPVAPTIAGSVITAGRLRATILTPGTTATIVRMGTGYRVDISGGTTSYQVRLETV